ncbi:MAG: Biopolymer transport protein ExbD/TolR; potentially related to transport or biosynthesis of folate, partial [uncultured Cytophagales bacterium]
ENTPQKSFCFGGKHLRPQRHHVFPAAVLPHHFHGGKPQRDQTHAAAGLVGAGREQTDHYAVGDQGQEVLPQQQGRIPRRAGAPTHDHGCRGGRTHRAAARRPVADHPGPGGRNADRRQAQDQNGAGDGPAGQV